MNTIVNTQRMPLEPIRLGVVAITPLIIIMAAVALHYFYQYYLIDHLSAFKPSHLVNLVEKGLYASLLAINCYWIINRLLKQTSVYFASTPYAKSHHSLQILVLSLTKIIKGIIFLVIFNLLIQNLPLPHEFAFFLNKASSILIISASGWILYQCIISVEQLLLHHYTSNSTGYNARKITTQLLILKRISLIIVGILVSGSILMLFDNVKALGASVLTTAGIIGLVMTFTAQKTLGGLFSGLEIALTQPIKIGDAVMIENEFGIIEEINFRNVIIKLWDWRRLIVPTNYFLENSFQNWSREESNNLIGTVYLYLDYTAPVDELRAELHNVLTTSPLWDGNISKIQVSDLQDKVMQLRILSSADSPSKAWDLRCEVRERLISYIVKNHPEWLPISRSKTFKED